MKENMINPVFLHLKIPQENQKGPIAMETALSGIAEVFRPSSNIVSLELVIRRGYLYFFLVCERQTTDLIKGQLFAQYPNMEAEETKDYISSISPTALVSYLKLERPDIYSIKTYRGLETDFLSNLSGLATSIGANETVAVQVLIQPINTKGVKYHLKKAIKDYWYGSGRKNSSIRENLEENQTAKEEKSLFKSAISLFIDAGEKSSALATSATTLFKLLENPNFNSFKLRKTIRGQKSLEIFKGRQFPAKTFQLNSEEIATFYHLPTQESGVVQATPAKAKTAEPPENLPVPPAVVPFATTNFRGNSLAFNLKRVDRRKHLYVIGKSGVGKTKLIELLALADIREKKGCVIMDPHGDMAEEILRYIPRERLYDVVYFNPADTEFPMGFNPLEGVGTFEFKQNVVAGFIAIFKKLFGFTWNQRLEHVLRYTTLALLDVPGSTVLGITRMLTDTRYRQQVISQIQDPLVKKFWATEFASWNEQFSGEAITPIINKIGQFVANPIIRNVVGQTKSTVKLDEIINGEKILIANFAIGKLGEENSALFGAMFVTKLWQAAIARATIPEEDRKDCYLYIDEFQNFATGAFANIFSEARKYRLNLTVAHQYMAQLPPEVRSTVFGNAGSTIAFRVGGEDAAVLEKEYQPVFCANDFMNLDMRNFFIKMIIDGQTVPPFSGKTIDFPATDENFYSDAVRISRERWARPRVEVEKEIAAQGEGEITSSVQTEELEKSFSEPIV